MKLVRDVIRSVLVAGTMALAPAAFTLAADDFGLEPCMNGDVSASGLLSIQAVARDSSHPPHRIAKPDPPRVAGFRSHPKRCSLRGTLSAHVCLQSVSPKGRGVP